MCSVHKINERIYYAVHLKLLSPLSISNGTSDATDSDVLLDAFGAPFIPGTSLAGAFRNDLQMDRDAECFLGFSKAEDGRMSQLYIQDVFLAHSKRTVRDGIRLNEGKTVERGGKFDREIVETGAAGWLFMELILRDGIKGAEQFTKYVNTILCDIQSGQIRIGANKNRGFGRICITELYEKHFKNTDVDEWLEFLEDTHRIENYRNGEQKKSFDDWKAERERLENNRYLKITIPLEVDGGISIRRYSAEPGKADYEHITCNGEPVIPGSSWNGAIRGRALRMLRDLQAASAQEYIDEWFGYVDQDKDKDMAWQSHIVVGESVVKGAEWLPVARTRINRFTAAASDGGLYQELSCFCGTTSLEILVDRGMKNYEACVALLDFVWRDIQKGYLAVGGQVAVGRGLFRGNGQVSYSDPMPDLEVCRKALFDLVKG